MLYDHAHAMQVKLCKANTRGVTAAAKGGALYGSGWRLQGGTEARET